MAKTNGEVKILPDIDRVLTDKDVSLFNQAATGPP